MRRCIGVSVGMMLIVGLLTACSTLPRVVADVAVTLPPKQTDSVMIYDVGDTIPATAAPIGTVKVTDGGFTPTYKCLYSQMLALAVNKTIECGGNALRIDQHKLPSMASTCHRIWGTMYQMPDSLVVNDVHTSLTRLESRKDEELLAVVKQQIDRMERMKNLPANVLKVSFGPSWITSRYITPVKEHKSKLGMEFALGYEHLWKSGFGFGIDYLHFNTTFDENYGVKLNYLGPSLVLGYMIGEKWRWGCQLGLGLSTCSESYGGSSEKESNIGMMGGLNVDYMLSKHVGLGISWNTLTMYQKKPADLQLDDNEFYGIRRMNLLAGLRIYL